MTQGLNAYQNADYPKALKKFEKYLRFEADDSHVREAAAYTASRAEKWKEAAKHWLEVSKINPRRPGPIQQHVNALIRAKEFEAAEAYCMTDKLLQTPAQAGIRDSLLVRNYLAQGRLLLAQSLADQSYAHAPTPRLSLECARGFFEQKHYGVVEQWVDRIPPDSKEAAHVPMLRARLYYVQKKWEKAEEAFGVLAESSDTKQAQQARLFLARIAANKGDTTLAENRFQRVLDDTPGHEEATTFFIRAAIVDQDPETALELLKSNWTTLHPVRRVQFKARAIAMTDPDAARSIYQVELNTVRDSFALRLSHCDFLMDLGHFDIAEAEIQTCLDIAPDSIEALRLRLRFLQATNAGFESQLDHAQRMLEHDALNVTLLNTVGGLLARCGRRTDAIRHYRTAVQNVPHAAVLWRNGVYHTMMDNRLEEAETQARRAVAFLGTESAEDLANAAWIVQAANLTDDALTYVTEAVALDPNSLKAREMAVELQMVSGQYAYAWENIQQIDAMQFPRRNAKIAHAAAQCMAAFRAMAQAKTIPDSETRDDPIESRTNISPAKGLFPEQLFDAIVAIARPDPCDRHGIVHLSSNLGSGGAERQVAYVAQGLAEQPVPERPATFVINSLDPNGANDFFLPEVQRSGLKIVDLDAEREASAIRHVLVKHPHLAPVVRSLAALPAELSRTAIPFYAHLVEQRPKVVHLWQDAVNIAGGMAAVAAGVPQIVLCTRSTRPVEIRRYRRYLHSGYQSLMRYKGGVAVVNNSANGARDYEDWLGWSKDSIGVFYNGYDFKSLRGRATKADRARIRAQFQIPANASVVGGVMRFSAEKRPDLWVQTMMQAVGQNADVYGLIVGDGPMRADLIAQIEVAGLTDRVHFAGRQSPVEPWMRSMDMLFLSSVTEGLPNVLIEAQALGVPVATMNVGGAPEAMSVGVSGIALEENTPDALATQILTVLTDHKRMARMQKAAVKFVDERFDLSAMIARLKSFYTFEEPK
ncbi:glycosyltransferase [Yoonia sp. R2-816]